MDVLAPYREGHESGGEIPSDALCLSDAPWDFSDTPSTESTVFDFSMQLEECAHWLTAQAMAETMTKFSLHTKTYVKALTEQLLQDITAAISVDTTSGRATLMGYEFKGHPRVISAENAQFPIEAYYYWWRCGGAPNVFPACFVIFSHGDLLKRVKFAPDEVKRKLAAPADHADPLPAEQANSAYTELAQALNQLSPEHGAEILQNLPRWLTRPQGAIADNTTPYRPWLAAALLVISEADRRGVKEDKSNSRARMAEIIEQACKTTKAGQLNGETGSADLDTLIRIARKRPTRNGRPKKG